MFVMSWCCNLNLKWIRYMHLHIGFHIPLSELEEELLRSTEVLGKLLMNTRAPCLLSNRPVRYSPTINMISIILLGVCSPWTTVRAYIIRRCHLKKDTAGNNQTRDESDEICGDDAPDSISDTIHVAPIMKRNTPCCSDTNLMVDQLTVLAASISQSSSRNSVLKVPSTASLVTTRTTQSIVCTKDYQLAEEKSFHYLRSLITISCLPQHSPGRVSMQPATQSTEDSMLGRKRASSSVSIRLGDLPGLSFPTKVSRKPCPRYTTLPPLYSPRRIQAPPEVRFWNKSAVINQDICLVLVGTICLEDGQFQEK